MSIAMESDGVRTSTLLRGLAALITVGRGGPGPIVSGRLPIRDSGGAICAERWGVRGIESPAIAVEAVGMRRKWSIIAGGTGFVGSLGRLVPGGAGAADQEGWSWRLSSPGSSSEGAESAVPEVLGR